MSEWWEIQIKKIGIVKDFQFWKKMNQLVTIWVGFYILYIKQYHFVSCKTTSLYPLSMKKIRKYNNYRNVYLNIKSSKPFINILHINNIQKWHIQLKILYHFNQSINIAIVTISQSISIKFQHNQINQYHQ